MDRPCNATAPVPPRRVLILGAAPSQLLDIAGPAEILAQAGHLRACERGTEAHARLPLYAVSCLIVPEPGSPATSAGLAVQSTVTEVEALAWTDLDTLIVVGGEGARRRCTEDAIRTLAQRLAAHARRVVGVCTGAFILAEAGCLRGRKVTTHWRWCDALRRLHPDLAVDPEPIYVRDGDVWTSAGITAGMDLTLALVEADYGHALALAVARELVMFLRRPGGQKQFSTVLSAQTSLSVRLADLIAWMGENLHRPLPVEALAARAGLSPRQFARAFRAETGVTPARMLERLRVESARRMLETDRAGVSAVAARCGFQADETMRRAFLRHLGVPPGSYRNTFRTRHPSGAPTPQKVLHA
ncbi:GlxA family transcriptional regulator [Methylobacterium planeticum]|uniref:Helix-turn-helix domain-containing protein n=1 Tax=Methylobacterium planeticum TaxID=2615211 RepID=A0A6N6MT61_9HYPH|nr:helix-turn-helix domain-containing protein [Methylobacterium planeticum]KAB1072665.1 helix-turn-helix domain-containing protein [Methylobacterium planeticum]